VVVTSDAHANRLCLSHTQRSSLADVEFWALHHGSSLQTTPIESESRPIGTAFHYERRVGGLRTGTYDGAVLLSPDAASAEAPLRFDALTSVFGGSDVVTLRIVGSGLPIELVGPQTNRKDTEVTVQPSTVQEVMPLESTYLDFLQRLGQNTRRNILKCREQAKMNNIKFSASHSIELLRPLDIHKLAKKNMPFPVDRRNLAKMIQFVSTHPKQFHTYLNRPGERPFSISGGFIEGDIAFMTYQLNDRSYRGLTPSLMLRSFLTEYFIDVGVRYIAFVGGCSGLLLYQCTLVPAVKLLFVRRTVAARGKHLAMVMRADLKRRIARQSSRFIELTKANPASD
jgi:hypothetical protein